MLTDKIPDPTIERIAAVSDAQRCVWCDQFWPWCPHTDAAYDERSRVWDSYAENIAAGAR